MKPVRKMDSTSQNCSCTSCIYRSESEQSSIRKYIGHGSRIDRLYYGKYVPLRERKLLNRLVRTRAVYDDLRTRLISDSTLSLDNNADLRPRNHHHEIKRVESSEKSGAILELVNFIDKGAVLGPRTLSECCSCCSCSSKTKILDSNKKGHKRQRTYGEGYHTIKHGRPGAPPFARTHGREYGQTVYGKTRERYNRRGVHFKPRNIRSDPCTCTLKFSGLIKKQSMAMLRKMRHVPLEDPILITDKEPVLEKSKLQNLARESHQKYKELHDNLELNMKKLKESATNLKQNLQVNAKKSFEDVKEVKDKVKTNIESQIRKSIQAARTLQPKRKKLRPMESEAETTFQIKKDSIVKFKDYLQRKEEIKDWECDLECIPDDCVPEQCFRIIKLRRLEKRKRKRDRGNVSINKIISREAKVGERQLLKSSSVQVHEYTKTTATNVQKNKPRSHVEGRNQVIGPGLIFEAKEENKVGFKDGKQDINRSFIPTSININKENTRSYGKNRNNIRKKHNNLKELRTLKEDKSDSRNRQAVRIRSSVSFEVEFYKKGPESKKSLSTQPSGTHTKKTKKPHVHKGKKKKMHRRHQGSQITLQSSLGPDLNDQYKNRFIQTNNTGPFLLLPFECEPFTCQPGECDPRECIKRVSDVKTNTDYGKKSVSSEMTFTLPTANKHVSKQVQQKERLSQASLIPSHRETGINKVLSSHKQAVRIGSTFSFNVEFYKKNTQNLLTEHISNEEVKQISKKKNYVSPKVKQVKDKSRRAYKIAKTNVRRCFCTLKLHKIGKTKNKVPTSTIGTLTAQTTIFLPSMVDKYVETKKNNRFKSKIHILPPYECELGVCIPGECDPIFCNQILKLRNASRPRYKSRGSYTSSRKTKSTSSIVSRSTGSVKTKFIQSAMAPTKPDKTKSSRSPGENLILGRRNLKKTHVDAPGRQAVRVSSSFSFNIEFYKDNLIPAVENKPNIPSIQTRGKVKKPTAKQDYLKDNKQNKFMLAEVNKRNMNLGPSFKRCFCLLKLNNGKTKITKKTKIPTENTQTLDEAPYIRKVVDKATKTKWTHSYSLLPFECEPNICIPGECDPYSCLEKINRHGPLPEMRSMSSYTGNPYKHSTAISVQPKLIARGTKMREAVKHQKITQRAGEAINSENSKQAVRIGSSLNFSIEFSKQIPPVVQLSKFSKNKLATDFHPIKYKNTGIKVTKARVDHANTQSLEPRNRNKSSLVRPMLKRCFCTLNLQKNFKKHHIPPTPTNTRTKYFSPNIYTISTAMTTRTEIISQKLGLHNDAQIPPAVTKMVSISASSFLLKRCSRKTVSSSFQLCPVAPNPIEVKQQQL